MLGGGNGQYPMDIFERRRMDMLTAPAIFVLMHRFFKNCCFAGGSAQFKKKNWVEPAQLGKNVKKLVKIERVEKNLG